MSSLLEASAARSLEDFLEDASGELAWFEKDGRGERI
jgi:hypothetical protein